jgi:hypothetical protein
MDWIHLDQGRGRWRVPVITVMELQYQQKADSVPWSQCHVLYTEKMWKNDIRVLN